MNDKKIKAYATMCGVKGDPTGQQKFYQIYFTHPSKMWQAWKGPYRDSTDAENAAEDEAQQRGLELAWTD